MLTTASTIAGLEFDVELLVIRDLKHPQRNIAQAFFFGVVRVAQQRPAAIGGAEEKRARMAGVAKRKAPSGLEESGENGGGETAVARKLGKLLVEQAHDFFLVQAIDEAPHQRAQVGCGGSDGVAVAGNVGEKQAADASAGATGNVIHIAAALRFAERLAVNPNVQAAQFDAAGSELAAAPNFHALHVLRGRIRHRCIITVGRELNRIDVVSLTANSVSLCSAHCLRQAAL